MDAVTKLDAAYLRLKLAKKSADTSVTAQTAGQTLQHQAIAHVLKTQYGEANYAPHHLKAYAETIQDFAKNHAGAAAYQKLLGEFGGGSTVSQPQVEKLADALGKSGLVGVANKALTTLRPELGVAPLTKLPPKPTPRGPSGFVELPPEDRRPTIREGVAKPKVDRKAAKEAKEVERINAANRARDAAEAQPSPPVAEEAPLPLADVPGEGKSETTRGHHAAIFDALVRNRLPVAEAIKRLAEDRGVTPAVARKHVKAFLETRHLHAQPVDPSVVKLAASAPRKPTTGYAKIKNTRLAQVLEGLFKEHHRPKGTVALGGPGTEPVQRVPKKEQIGQHPQVRYPGVSDPVTVIPGEGWEEAIAQHPIAAAAQAILKHGPKAKGQTVAGMGVNQGNQFIRLGKLLEKAQHPLAKAYNWSRMGETMEHDEKVDAFLAKQFGKSRPEGMSERDFLASVLRKYSLEAANHETLVSSNPKVVDARKHDPAAHAEFWKRAEAAGFDRQKMNDALYRAYALADDRHEKAQAPRQPLPGQTVTTPGAGKGAMNSLANKALKFSRFVRRWTGDEADVATAGIMSQLGLVKLAKRPDAINRDAIVKSVTAEPGEGTGHAAFADWMMENGVPGAEVAKAHEQTLRGLRVKGRVNIPSSQTTGIFALTSKPGRLTGAGEQPSFNDLKASTNERQAPLAQVGVDRDGVGHIAVAHRADPKAKNLREGGVVLHRAVVRSKADLEQLMSDFPDWSKQRIRAHFATHLPTLPETHDATE